MNQMTSMNQPARAYPQAPSPSEPDSTTPRRDLRALLAAPIIGGAATAASSFTALLTTGLSSYLFTGTTDQTLPANVYVNTHFTDAYLTHNPLPLAACCALVAAATAVAATRRRGLAALLLCAAAATPWFPAIGFLHHVWQLAPVSTRG